uniref:Sodium/solute symporter n=1 Tax=Macrostomum lignano TaxID=282301 RepID=A0A1I8IU64_9PLAT
MATQTEHSLQWYDYLVFGLVLAFSGGVGIFFAFRARRNTSQEEYLLASKQLTVGPIALSLLASFISAITLLANEVFIPVFHRLRVNTSYQYLRLRFHKCVQIAGSISFCVQMVLYMGIVIYAPSLALSQVTGFNVWIAVASIGLVATFYTSIGGIKAVVWTDVFQIVMMLTGLVATLIRGIMVVGGFAAMWEKADQGRRIEFFNLSLDPTERHTVWTQIVANTFVWLSIYGINQTMVQRCLSLSSLRQIKIAYWINMPGLFLLMLTCSICGMTIFAAYGTCDPLLSGRITANDQAALGIFGMVGGPLLGVFTLGMFFRVANWKGAAAGHLVSQIFVFWIGFGYYVHGVQAPTKPMYTYNCTSHPEAGLNSSSTVGATTATSPATTAVPSEPYILPAYKVSYTWYAMYGWLTAILVGLVVSLLTRDKEAEKNIPRDYFTPMVRHFMKPTPEDIQRQMSQQKEQQELEFDKAVSILKQDRENNGKYEFEMAPAELPSQSATAETVNGWNSRL